MTRKEQLVAMRPRDLIALADRLGVKVAASKNRVNLKEKKMNVIERILLAEESEEISMRSLRNSRRLSLRENPLMLLLMRIRLQFSQSLQVL